MKTLYAGPWIGEFGWELTMFNPIVRAEARHYDRVVVASHAASEYLYEFADEFIPLEARGHAMHTGTLISPKPVPHPTHDMRIEPTVVNAKNRGDWKKEYIRLGSSRNGNTPIMFAFRPPKPIRDKNPMRKAYPPEMCKKLVSMLPKGYAYGGPDNWIFQDMMDLRGMDLETQCDILSMATVAIGPSSGTMHLASLCGCPHVTWCDHANVRKRYEANWNPFATPVRYLKGIPSPEEVVEAAKEIMR